MGTNGTRRDLRRAHKATRAKRSFKLASFGVAAALVLAPFGASMASAEEAPIDDTSVTTPAPETSVEEATPAPVEEAPVTPDVSEPVQNTEPEKQPVVNTDTSTSQAPSDVAAPAPKPSAPAAEPKTEAPADEAEQSTDKPATSEAAPRAPTTKGGKLQPVWCHLTGYGWKAQLGAKPSGGREEAFALVGDYGNGTTKDGQTLAHDRSSKLDAACQYQAPEDDPDTVTGEGTFMTATCEADYNNAILDAVEAGMWVFTDKDGVTHTLAKGEGYNGDVPLGLAYGEITVTLSQHPDSTEYDPIVDPVTYTWTTVDPATLECGPVLPPNPDPKVSEGEWVDGEWVCGDTEVSQTRTVTTVTGEWIFKDGKPFLKETTTTETETGSRALTEEELATCPPDPGTVTGEGTFGTATCEVPSNNAKLDAVEAGMWVFTDKDGVTHTLAKGEGYDGDVPQGLAYGEITVTLSQHPDSTATDPIVDPVTYTWTTVDPATLECNTDGLKAKVWIKIIDATCTEDGEVRFSAENATWGDPVRTDVPNVFDRPAYAAKGVTFEDGSTMVIATYTVPVKLDPNSAACKPPVDPTPDPEPTPKPTKTPPPVVPAGNTNKGDGVGVGTGVESDQSGAIWFLTGMLGLGGLMVARGIRRSRHTSL